MSFKWLPLFISISLLSLYDAASTVVHSNAYDNLLRTYNSDRAAADYHEKVYKILGGNEGFSNNHATPVQLSNIMYIAVHAALANTESDTIFLQKILKENQLFINLLGPGDPRKKDRIYHYGILMIVYAATKLSQQDANIFTLPERVQNYLKNLAEDSILTGVFAQPLKDNLSRVNKDGIAQILVNYKFTNAYHSASLNVGGLMLDGAVAVDYTHGAGDETGSGVTTRASSSTVTPSSSTGSMTSATTSDVPADIAHLDPKYIKKLKMMSFISETPGNKLSRQAVIDKYTKEQESEKAATPTAAGGGNRSALFSQLNGGAFSLKKVGSSTKDKGGAFNPKDARKVRLNKSTAASAIRDESSITKEIVKLEGEIAELQLQLVELGALKSSSGSTEKIERQIVGKTKLIEGKKQAIQDKIKERGLLIAKKMHVSGKVSASEREADTSLTSVSVPISVSGAASIPLGEPEVLLAAPVSPPIIVTRPAAPSIIVSPPIVTKVNPVPPQPPAPALPKKPLKIVATGSIFADLSMSHTGSLRKVSNTVSALTDCRTLSELNTDLTESKKLEKQLLKQLKKFRKEHKSWKTDVNKKLEYDINVNEIKDRVINIRAAIRSIELGKSKIEKGSGGMMGALGAAMNSRRSGMKVDDNDDLGSGSDSDDEGWDPDDD